MNIHSQSESIALQRKQGGIDIDSTILQPRQSAAFDPSTSFHIGQRQSQFLPTSSHLKQHFSEFAGNRFSCQQSDAAIRSRCKLQPEGGKGDKVIPPTYVNVVYAT